MSVEQTIHEGQTNIEQVKALVMDIDTSKSSDVFTALPNVIVRMYNVSLSNGVVPELWKRGTVIPVKKCGNSSDVNISLLPLQGKLL